MTLPPLGLFDHVLIIGWSLVTLIIWQLQVRRERRNKVRLIHARHHLRKGDVAAAADAINEALEDM